MPTVNEVYALILNGDIKYDHCGHNSRYLESQNKRMAHLRLMSEHTHSLFKNEYNDVKDLNVIADGKCLACGERLIFTFDGGVLRADTVIKYRDDSSIPLYERFHTLHVSECAYANPKPYVGEITVSDTLVFTNWFHPKRDCLEQHEHSDEYNVSYLAGRDNIAKFKQQHNIAYGQLGNMNYYVWVHKNKKSILLVDRDLNDYPELKQFDELQDYQQVGQGISTAMWRWEATDKATLGPAGYQAHQQHADAHGMGIVEVDVEHGNWMYEHFYDRMDILVGDVEDGNDVQILARWTLKE